MLTNNPVSVSADWTLVYDAEADGDLQALVQSRGAGGAYWLISDSKPDLPIDGYLVPENVLYAAAVSASDNAKLYCRSAAGGSVVAVVCSAADSQSSQQIASVIGNKSDAPASNDSGSFSLMSMIKRISSSFTTFLANISNYTSTGTISALNQEVGVPVGNRGAVGIQLTGTPTGCTVSFYASMDGGSSYTPVNVTPFSNGGDNNPVGSTSTAGRFVFVGGGFTNFKAVVTTGASAGSFDCVLTATPSLRNVGVPAIGSALDSAASSDTGNATLIQLVKRLLTKFTNDSAGRLLTLGRLDYRTSQMEATLQGKCFFAQIKATTTASQYQSLQIWNPANSGKALQVSSVLAAVQTAGKVYPFIEAAAIGSGSGGAIINNKSDGSAASFQMRTNSAGSATSPLVTEGIQVTSTTTSGQGLLISGQSIVLMPGYGLRYEYASTSGSQAFTLSATVTEIDIAQVS